MTKLDINSPEMQNIFETKFRCNQDEMRAEWDR